MKRGLLLVLVIFILILVNFPLVNASIFDFLFQKPSVMEETVMKEIYNCTKISRPGNYILRSNIKTSESVCIEIDAEGVLLDCDNKEIYFEGVLADRVGIWIKNNGTIIKNCKIKNFSVGIWISTLRNQIVENLYNVIIFENFLENNTEGIAGRTTYGKFFNNTFINNHFGFYLDAFSENNSLSNNFFKNSGYAAIEDFGITTRIENNVIENSQLFGLESAFGIRFTSPRVIAGNQIRNCSTGIVFFEGEDFIVTNNLIEGNGKGIDCHFASNITLESNIISKNEFDGILLTEVYNYSIKKNAIFLNNRSAIHIISFINPKPFFNVIEENKIYNNALFGVFIENFSENNLFLNNLINFNGKNGIMMNFGSSGNNFINNIVCYNSILDISNEGSGNWGVNNSCDSTVNWSEGNRRGCTYTCIQQVPVNETQRLVCYMDGTTCVDYSGRYPPYCIGNSVHSYLCLNNRCVLNDAILMCPSGQICENGTCVSQKNLTQCEQYGGICAYSCPSGYAEVDFSCQESSGNLATGTSGKAIYSVLPRETKKICCMKIQIPIQSISSTGSVIKEFPSKIFISIWDFVKSVFSRF